MRIIDYIHQGGPIMYILLTINIIGLALMISKIIVLSKEKQNIPEVSSNLGNKIKTEASGKNSDVLIELSKRELSSHMDRMEKGLGTIKTIATISPLLGLLGTVIGVLVSFKVISVTGLTDPSNFAEGISMALITTVGGMIVAIPHYIGHNYLMGYLDHLEVNLEKEIITKVL
jgi:biopolymer transport protein ExbB